MKKLTVLCSALFAFTVSAELWAQNRGPRYNPPSGGGGSRSGGSSSSGSSSRGSSYNPPSRSSGSSSSSSSSRGSSSPSRSSGSSSSSSSRGSSYNPPSRSSGGSSSSSSSSSSRGSRYNPPSSSGSSSSSSTRGPSYNPPSSSGSSSSTTYTPSTPVPGPRYNPTPTPDVRAPRTPTVVRGPRYHNPVKPPVTVIRYPSGRDYWTSIHRHHIYHRWILSPVIFTYSNGHWMIDGYPYYVYNGYRHRYNPVETCHYQLVDGNDNTVVKDFKKECNAAYDECAVERDALNSPIGLERYFCAEAVDEDLAVPTEEYSPAPVEISDVKKAAIVSYLAWKSLRDIHEDGYKGGVGECLVYKLRGNQYGCKWIVTVGDEYYPDPEGSVCSEDDRAALIGCNVGDEKTNAGCILKKAIQEGYCH